MMPYRDGSGEALWVPGVLVVDEPIRIGPDVGWLPFRDIDDWKREAIFVEKRALAGRALPEARIDAARFPHVRPAAEAATLVAFAVGEKAALLAAGLRVYTVRWHRVADAGYLGAEGGGGATVAVDGELQGLRTDDPGDDDDAFDALTADRVMAVLSDNIGTSDAAELAAVIREVLAGLDGPVDAALASWEAWLAPIVARAALQQDAARTVVAALAAAAERDACDVAPLGKVRRVRAPALEIRRSADDPATLALPAASTWVVDGLEPWRPAGAPFPRPPRTVARRQSRLPWAIALALAILVAFLLAIRG